MAIYRQLCISFLIISVEFYHDYNAQELATDPSIVADSPLSSSPVSVDTEELSEFSTVSKGCPLKSARGPYLNLTQYPGKACNRMCIAGQRRACYFEFNLEHYQAMGVACGDCKIGVATNCYRRQCVTGDGVEKGVMSINRQVPGPAIQVCRGDAVIVDVINQAGGTAAAIHWHGQHMRETPYMDGVPFVTQCPIPFATTFRYEFTATESGTHWYHSHSGHHKVNGQYGALIVREPRESVANLKAFDYDLPEHYILISDWMHAYGEQLFPGLPGHDGIYPDSVLINGRGSYINPKTHERTSVPPTRYNVKPGKRYRFRVINAASHACPFQLQVQSHRLTVIASDGFDVEPRDFDTLVSNSGERYDFVLTANHTRGIFWVRVRGMGICALRPTETVAQLRYLSNDVRQKNCKEYRDPQPPDYNDEYPLGDVLNHPSAICTYRSSDHCVSELRAVDADEELRLSTPDQKFFLGFNNYPVPNEEIFKPGLYRHFANLRLNQTIVGAIDNLSLIFPSYPPLTQPRDIDETQFCDKFNLPEHCRDYQQLCPCVHRLKIKLGSIVELIVVDESRAVGILHHPFHVHGFGLMVTGMGQYPEGVPMTVSSAKELEKRRKLPRIDFNIRPPFKDTLSIPSRGFVILRFRADNPGFWLMHCHYEWHLAIGMGLILQVGRPSQMVSAPRDFPTCGNYQPRVRRLD